MRAFAELWDEITRERYGVNDREAAAVPLRRAGELARAHRAAAGEQRHRILIEMLAVTLSKNARARAVQLPAWNEALGLPRPWDQQWSLRMQQILAYETDLLEYGDMFDGSPVIAAKVEELKREALEELAHIEAHGRRRRRGRERLHEEAAGGIQHPAARGDRARRADRGRRQQLHRDRALAAFRRQRADPVTISPKAPSPSRSSGSTAWRAARDAKAVEQALDELKRAARGGPQHHAALDRLRQSRRHHRRMGRRAARSASANIARPPASAAPRATTPRASTTCAPTSTAVSRKLGRRLKFLVGKPGLDGHSNGAEQIAVRARDAGMDVVYEGIRLTPAEIVERRARRSAPMWSGCRSCRAATCRWCATWWRACVARGSTTCRSWSAASSRPRTRTCLQQAGVAAVYTPKDFELNRIMADLVRIVAQANGNNA